tara:strand:- start:103 stop:330 length:228 start_codon:yes stop_codon:yes gene_type:complete
MIKRIMINPSDFTQKWINKQKWPKYLEQFPNMLFGTHVVDKKEDMWLIKRFKSKNRCSMCCTAPTTFNIEGRLLN